MVFELHHLTAQEQWDWLSRAEVTPLELVEHYLRRIERWNGELGALSRVDADRALDRARRLPESVPRSAELWGLPYAEKELARRAGHAHSGGSRAFAERLATENDAVVDVLDAAGGISLGATTAPEFGFPSYTEPLGRPPARNPWRLDLGAGGSSGGAAVAVSAGLLPFAHATDGGGSARIPAAATGLVGLKPSRGLIAADPDALAGLVTNGAIARTVADAAMLVDAMTARVGGALPSAHTVGPPDPGRLLGAAVRGEGRFQIGVCFESPWEADHDIRLDPDARRAVDDAIRMLIDRGHGVEEVGMPPVDGYSAAFRTVWQAGAAALPLDESALELVEPLTAWLVREGRRLPVARLVEALAWLAAWERSLISRWFSTSGARLDAVLTPSMALTPRPLGWYDSEDGDRNFRQQVEYTPFTSYVNVSGLPAIALPTTMTADGVPMGVQLVGRPGGEATLVSIARQLERALSWERRHPAPW